MDRKAANFLKKKNISPRDILYIIHKNRKTSIHLKNGDTADTFISLKYILSALPKGAFLNINKGIALASSEISAIRGNTYIMSDGREFAGRKRSAGEHKTNRRSLENAALPSHRIMEATVREQFSLLDASPMPCAVVEVMLNSAGHPVDLAFVYCNQAMADYERCDLEDMMHSTLYSSVQSADRIWLNIFTDVARTGRSRIIEGTKPEKSQDITLYCWRPSIGYCAYMLVSGKVVPK